METKRVFYLNLFRHKKKKTFKANSILSPKWHNAPLMKEWLHSDFKKNKKKNRWFDKINIILPWNTCFHSNKTFCITLWEKICKAVENLWFQKSVLYPISWQQYPNSTKSQTNKSNSSPVFGFSTSLSNRRGEIGAFCIVRSCCPLLQNILLHIE